MAAEGLVFRHEPVQTVFCLWPERCQHLLLRAMRSLLCLPAALGLF